VCCSSSATHLAPLELFEIRKENLRGAGVVLLSSDSVTKTGLLLARL
jgi:hypothetical protein